MEGIKLIKLNSYNLLFSIELEKAVMKKSSDRFRVLRVGSRVSCWINGKVEDNSTGVIVRVSECNRFEIVIIDAKLVFGSKYIYSGRNMNIGFMDDVLHIVKIKDCLGVFKSKIPSC